MANYTHLFNYDKISTLNYNINNATAGQTVAFTFSNMPDNWIGIITRTEDQKIWAVNSLFNNEITCLEGVNTFTFKLDDKEVILTEGAVKQLIQNIKDADDNIKNNYIPKNTLSGAYDIMYSSAANTPTRLAANTASSKKFLRMKGTGSAGAAPAWDTVTKSDVGLGSVENTALSSWTGSSNITTIGTLSSGTVPWARLSDVPKATSGNNATLGLVKIGNNININNGEISVSTATSATLGLVKIGNNIEVNNGVISVSAATNDKLGLVQIGDNIEVNNGVISVAKISSCIALNNKSLYLSRLQTDGSTTAIISDRNTTISPDGKIVTYTITDADLGGNANVSDLSENSVIMVAPVYRDLPNENLCYYKVGTDDDYDNNLGGSNKGYYEFINNEFTNEGFTITSSNFSTLRSNPGLYTKNENSDTTSSWEWWDSLGIVCTQDEANLNKLKFYLKEAAPIPSIDNDANLPAEIIKRLQIRINIAIFL